MAPTWWNSSNFYWNNLFYPAYNLKQPLGLSLFCFFFHLFSFQQFFFSYLFCSILCSLSSFFLVYLQLLSMHDCCIRVIHNMVTALLEPGISTEAYVHLIHTWCTHWKMATRQCWCAGLMAFWWWWWWWWWWWRSYRRWTLVWFLVFTFTQYATFKRWWLVEDDGPPCNVKNWTFIYKHFLAVPTSCFFHVAM